MSVERRATVTVLSNTRCVVGFTYPGWEKKARKKERTRITNLLDDALAIETKGSHFNPTVQSGLWDGRRHLFYKDGCTFPFGIIKRVKRLLREAGYKVMKTKDERKRVHGEVELERVKPDMLKGIELRDDQIRVIEAALESGCGLLHMATGGGKTECAAAIIKALIEKRCLFLVHTKQLLKQARDRIALRLGTIEEHIGIIGDGRFEPKHITIATVQSLTRVSNKEQKKIIAKYLKTIDLLFLDECFPAGTMVGDKPIESIRVGDLVPSFDGRRLVMKHVVRLFMSRPAAMVTVQVGDRVVTCTAGHPFLTSSGWVPAAALNSSDMVLSIIDEQNVEPTVGDRSMPGVWVHCEGEAWREVQARDAAEGTSLLLSGVPGRLSLAALLGEDDKHQPPTCFSSHEGQQSHEACFRPTKGERVIAYDGLEAVGQRRKRHAASNSAAALGTRAQMADGSCRHDQEASRFWIPEALQTRHRGGLAEGGDRGGRSIPLWAPGTGPQEGRVLAWSRVDRVEVLESTGDGTFGGVCQDGLVYNLEVEDTHTYVADGFVVHNCHHSSAKSFYRLIQRIDAPWRFGMSGTPFGLADGKGLMVEAAFGPVVERVTNEELIALGVNAKPTIRMVDVSRPEIDVDLDWQGVYKEGIVLNTYRNGLVVKWAKKFAKKSWPTLIIVRELWHGDNLCGLLREVGVKHAFVHGQMPTNEVERQKVRLVEGKIHVLVASPIFGEGVDVPSVRALIVADGGQSTANVLQKVGRGLRRKVGDNRLDVIDFADTTHRWLSRHSQERVALYEAEGFQVVV